MPKAEFLGLTPVELMALLKAWEARERRLDVRVALLRLTVGQAMGAKAADGGDLELRHFLPDTEPEEYDDDTIYQQFLNSIPSKWHPQDQSEDSTST